MTPDLYRTPTDMSDAGRQARLFDGLPHDVGGLAEVVQGLMVHEHIAPAYGLTLSPEQHAQAHWVTEYWNEAQQRWVLVDAQLDGRQREMFKIGFDPLDVPRDQFLVAGQAWELCRAGKADPDSFAILDMHGLWLIAGNVIRDVAALNNHEMLPWDVWGAMARTDAELDLPFFDRLAELSHAPDAHADELRAVYQDKRIAVPGTVFNAVLNRPDPIH